MNLGSAILLSHDFTSVSLKFLAYYNEDDYICLLRKLQDSETHENK